MTHSCAFDFYGRRLPPVATVSFASRSQEITPKNAEGLVTLQDPSKPAIKKHHSLVLRCESASEKYAWLARLKNVSETPAVERPVRKYTSQQLEEGRAGTAEKDKKRDGKPPKVKPRCVREMPPKECCRLAATIS